MRFFAFKILLVVMLASGMASPPGHSWAQSEVLVPEPEPIQPPENIDPNGLDEVPAEPSQDRLSELFGKLKKQTRPGPARATAALIWQEWIDSGSPTINLLMSRAGEAMRRKKSGLAEDLLDQVVVLQPEYAEGWNRRATLYFTLSDFSRSLADIRATLAIEPRHFGALSGLAAILQRLNRDKEALATWYRVLEIYPANSAAQKAVIELEEKLSGRRT